ncbi:MAG TPA: hypothetical protein IAB40_01305 [Candidatus Onthocola stercoravium]|nr:hypothetical protein [Candidatus Onthocola stercoravium]
MKQEQNYEEEYADNFTLTKDEMDIYNIPATFELVVEKLRELKIARNKYINGYHVRLTTSYRPRLEQFSQNISDPVGKTVEYRLDSEQAYNEFNIQLNKLYSTMSKEENAYINDCLLCGKSEASLRTKFDLGRETFNIIKSSAIVRFGIVFNIIVYK